MIVPRYWAEARLQHRAAGSQVTVRRYGWSDSSQADAQANAETRAREAIERVLAGEKLPRRDPKVPYNGASGVPIREEIIDQRGNCIITRNSYGALCLNTPDVFFADIDFDGKRSSPGTFPVFLVLLAVGMLLAGFQGWKFSAIGVGILALAGCFPLAAALRKFTHAMQGGAHDVAMKRIRRFSSGHREWNFRIYRTPAGLRVLATHANFQPDDPAVEKCFQALGTDPIYRLMCRNQKCFRARVSPKPWRIGIADHLRPRPGIWPIKAEHLSARAEWVASYNIAAKNHSSCVFEESIGSGIVSSDVLPVMEWHDELSRATSGLPPA